METYRFKAKVEKDGSVLISGLRPSQEVEIVVVERAGMSAETKTWFDDIRSRHPFVKMSKEEILEALRRTREEIWDEEHAS